MLNTNIEQQCQKILQKVHYQSIKKLGKGSFGHVILASKFTTSANFYAIKCISLKKHHRKSSHFSLVSRQTKAMCAIDHQNVVRLQNSFHDSGWHFIVMQYCDMGNLMQYQLKTPNGILTLGQSIKILQQILKGTLAIHSQNMIHRDLKCQNIFLKKNKNGNYTCKIGDFGFAKVIQSTTKTACGTIFFMAPQVMADGPYSFQADIWSIGVIFYYMLYGQHPFKSLNIQKEIQDKCKDGYKLSSYPCGVTANKDLAYLSDFFNKIFELNPKLRIKPEQILNHPLLSSQIETASDSGNDQKQQQLISWELDRVNFISETLKLVDNEKVLEDYLFYAFKLYLAKVVRIFLTKDEIQLRKKQKPQNAQIKQVNNKFDLASQDLQSAINCLVVYKSQTKKMQRFNDGCNMKVQDFVLIKQGYRNTVSRVYEQIHKRISNQRIRAQLKFRVFCCHLINRVFKTGVKEDIFPRFTQWKKQNSYPIRKQVEFKAFQKWIAQQSSVNLESEIQHIQKIFYAKN